VSDPNGRKRIKNTLTDSELRYRRLFETAKDGILILDAETRQITDANPFLQVMLGYRHAELLGKAFWEIDPFKDVVASRDAVRQLQAKEYVRYDNLPLETKEHERRRGVRQQRVHGRRHEGDSVQYPGHHRAERN